MLANSCCPVEFASQCFVLNARNDRHQPISVLLLVDAAVTGYDIDQCSCLCNALSRVMRIMTYHDLICSVERKEKTTSFVVTLLRSQALYQAAQRAGVDLRVFQPTKLSLPGPLACDAYPPLLSKTLLSLMILCKHGIAFVRSFLSTFLAVQDLASLEIRQCKWYQHISMALASVGRHIRTL